MTDVAYRWPGRDGFRLAIARLAVRRSERVLLLGPSGSGKSTLLSLVCGILAPEHGRITILGHDIAPLSPAARDRFRAEHIGVIFQMFNLLPYASVIDNVVLPLSFAPGRAARVAERGGAVAEARRLLSALGLPHDLVDRRSAADLSVGQQQRVAAARALIGRPELIIADEPTSALDADRRTSFMDLMCAEAVEAGAGLLMVSHDEALASRFDRVVSLPQLLAASPESVSAPALAEGAAP
jgi:putative ABC transport system ATP-binding protein